MEIWNTQDLQTPGTFAYLIVLATGNEDINILTETPPPLTQTVNTRQQAPDTSGNPPGTSGTVETPGTRPKRVLFEGRWETHSNKRLKTLWGKMTGKELLPDHVRRAACLSSASIFENATTQAKTSNRRDCRRTGGTLCAVLLRVLYMNASLPSTFALTQSEFNSAKAACLNEAASGICPNVETTHGKIGSWDVSSVTSLYLSKSWSCIFFFVYVHDWPLIPFHSVFWCNRIQPAHLELGCHQSCQHGWNVRFCQLI